VLALQQRETCADQETEKDDADQDRQERHAAIGVVRLRATAATTGSP
jgi:hypothetical protein